MNKRSDRLLIVSFVFIMLLGVNYHSGLNVNCSFCISGKSYAQFVEQDKLDFTEFFFVIIIFFIVNHVETSWVVKKGFLTRAPPYNS